MSPARQPAARASAVSAHPVPTALCNRLYEKAAAGRWPLDRNTFAEALARSLSHRFSGENPSSSAAERFLESLHLEDLALACACAEGIESAWDHFVREFRPILYAAARAIAGESSARELADSLYAELYGATPTATAEKRRSLFVYFHGRSKLSTWLRAVLSQRHVDAIRAGRRLESLDETESAEASEPPRPRRQVAADSPAPDPDRARLLASLQSALSAALAALDPRDRLRLSYYYLQDLTLAQIGRLLGEHEATVSRKLDRARHDIRKQVEATLRQSNRLSDAEIALCFQYAVEEWHSELLAPVEAARNTSGAVPRSGEGK